MPDITFDDLIKAKAAAITPQPSASAGGFLSDFTQEGLLELARVGLSIVQEVKGIQGAQGGGTVASRPAGEQTAQQTEATKPMVDIEQIKEALNMVKTVKGDITITSMLKLLEENKEVVAGYLKDV